MTLPFILLSIGNLLIDKKSSLAIIYFIVALYSALNPDYQEDFSGAVFFMFSFHSIKKKWYSVIIIISTILCISLKATKYDLRANVVMALIIAYGIVYVSYYFLIYRNKKTPPKRNIDIIIIDQEEKAILQLYCRGYSYDEISKTLSLNILGSSVRRKITSIMTDNNKTNDAQFGKWLYENV
jgi:DNA-binding CsgD family transcriptional regulator